MSVEVDIGKIVAAIEAGRRAAASIDYGPAKSSEILYIEQGRLVSDLNNISSDNSLFLFGSHSWGDTSKKATS